MYHDDQEPLLCHRCGAQLTPGAGNFYVVRIEAMADPSTPPMTEQDLQQDFDAMFERLLEQMKDMSPQELMDQVYRRLTIHLCSRCYKVWIEDPTR